MIIDRIVSDGVISVPRGITELEMLVLRDQFKVLGADKPKPVKKETKDDVTDWSIHRPTPQPAPPRSNEAPLPRPRD